MSRTSSPQVFTAGDAKENFSPVTTRKVRSASSNSAKASTTRRNQPDISGSVKVVLRVRGDIEDADNNFLISKDLNGKDRVSFKSDCNHAFTFDKALSVDANQEDTYSAVITNGVEHCLSGYHLCVLAYGQTGSGKTYSITGAENQPGLLPLFAHNLFHQISKGGLEKNVYVSLSFYEIYQEKIYDLLSSARKPLRIRGGADDAFVEHLTDVGVKNQAELEKWRRMGLSKRATAATLVNELSSRSHAIFCIKVQREFPDGRAVVARCFFVDLAGSERLHSSGDHLLNESISINKSLLALQRVVESRASNASFINYRDSVLTRLLKSCFAGNSITTLLATVSPLAKYSTETLNTLRFTSKASDMIQAPTVNEEKGVESVAYLREQSELFLQKIAEMAAQIEDLKQHAAVVEKIQAPAVLELFEDDSLNRWTSLDDNNFKLGPIDNQYMLEFILKNDQWVVASLAEGVCVNGDPLTVGKSQVAVHGDTISLHGRKFCALYLDESCDPRKFVNFDRAKLQYVQANFDREKQKLNEQMLEETMKKSKEVRESLQQELDDMRSQYAELQKKFKLSNAHDKLAVKKECEEVKSLISDAEEVQDNLLAEVAKQTSALKENAVMKEETEEEKAAFISLQSKVDLMNIFFETTGKSQFYKFRFDASGCVRLFNQKSKVFADLQPMKFNDLFNHLSYVYQSQRSKDEMIGEVEKVIYSTRFVWKPFRAGVGSSVVQQAVMNSLHETAKKRRSTYAEITQGFSSRRSVIAAIIQQPNEPVNEIENFLQHALLYAVTGHSAVQSEEQLSQLTEVEILLNACATARNNFDVFIAPDNFMTTSSLQKKALSLTGLLRSQGNLDVISTTAQFCYLMPEMNSFDYLPKQVIERSNCLRRLIEAWIDGVKDGTLSKRHGELIFDEIDRIIECVGHLAFFIGRKTRHSQANVQNIFERGIMVAIDELTEDVQDILMQCADEKTTRERFKKIAASFVADLLKYTDKSFEEEFIFRVLRRAIYVKEQSLTIPEDFAGKMIVKISELIGAAENLKSPLDEKTIKLLQDGLLSWKQLSQLAAKPPLPRRF